MAYVCRTKVLCQRDSIYHISRKLNSYFQVKTQEEGKKSMEIEMGLRGGREGRKGREGWQGMRPGEGGKGIKWKR